MVTTQETADIIDQMLKEDLDQRAEGLPSSIRWRSVSKETAEILNILARSMHAKNIVEIGTSQGYSTIWLALAARSTGGQVTTFEIEQWRFDQAKENLERTGLSDYVDLRLENTIDDPSSIPKDIDLGFIDAEKVDYLTHFKNLEAKLRPGGSIIADNTVSHSSEMGNFFQYIRNHSGFSSRTLTVGRGLEVSYKMMEDEKGSDLYQLIL
jgi:predicted O-methyltransferase YrrM